MQEKFNKKEYDLKYIKEHYSAIRVNISKELKEKFIKQLKKDNITISSFFKNKIIEYLKIK